MGSGPDLLQRLQRQVRELFITRDSDPYAEKLCLAAEDGNLEAMTKLLEKRSHPNVEDCTGERPLHIAVRGGHIKMVRLLLEGGADGEARNQDGLTPLQVTESLDNAFKRKEITTILGNCCSSPQSTQEPVMMGDDGDDESKHIREFKASAISTINEARSFEQEESISEDHENIEGLDDVAQTVPPQLTSVDSVGLIIVMVGLPGRGKTYIARRLCRWLNWKGTQCRIFNVGKYRRDREKEGSEDKAAYFDHKNEEAAAEREQLAKRASDDLISYLTNNTGANNTGAVAIFDATNSTKDRRRNLVQQFSDILPSDRVIFIESVCTDEEVVHNNILRAKMGNDDYKDKEAAYVIADFKARIRMYEQVYQPLSIESDEDRSWVQLRNTISSHMGGHITVNRISGHLPTKLLYFLFNLRTTVAPVYLAPISSTDQLAASAAVRRFFQTNNHTYETLRVWSPPGQQAVDSVTNLSGNSFLNRYYETLREIDRGECRGMTDEEVRKRMPDLYKERAGIGYSYAWPRGESYHDMNVRLEQIILDIHSSELPVLIIASNEVCQGLYAYLAELLPELCIHLSVPANSILEFGYKSHESIVHLHDISQWIDEATPMSAAEKVAFATEHLPAPPPQTQTEPLQHIPEYVIDSQPISAIAVAAGKDKHPSSGSPTPPLDIRWYAAGMRVNSGSGSHDELVAVSH